MKTKLLRSLLSLWAALLLSSALFLLPASAEGETITFSLRIEGITANVFYKTVTVPSDGTPTLQEALLEVEKAEEGLTFTGLDKAYITAINGEEAGTYGGYDGWMYRVNNLEPSVGMDQYALKAEDSVVLYYGDPFGAGMQYPEADLSKIADGVIRFTSQDTTYDDNYEPSTQTNPVKGATVTWKAGEESATYTTDDNGEIKIDDRLLTAGPHSLSISKAGEEDLPLILRLAPDFTVTVPETSGGEEDTSSPDSTDKPAPTPSTGDAAAAGAAGIAVLLSACLAAALSSTRAK